MLVADATDLTVAPTETGATVLWTLPGGGMWGVETDSSGNAIAAMKQLRMDGWIKNVSAARVAGKTIVAVQDGMSCIAVDLVAPGLVTFTEPDHLVQVHAGRVPALRAGGDHIAATSDATGITITPFDTSWNPLPSTLALASATPTALAATELANEAILVW